MSKITRRNQEFYRKAWNSVPDPKACEECGRVLPTYSAAYISHILSRGAWPQLRDHPDNFNILCWDCHNMWEDSVKRKDMFIYPRNMKRIEKLKKSVI